MKFIGKRCSLYTKGIHQIWCRSAKFLWKLKFSSGSGSGSWFHFQFQYQTYISYTEDTHQILFGSANSFESYCVHSKSSRTDKQTDSQADIFFLLDLSSKIYKTWTFIKKREFFFHSCDYNTFSFYILRMSWERKNDSVQVFCFQTQSFLQTKPRYAVEEMAFTHEDILFRNSIKIRRKF